ncbi:MAG TPA: discoidin domain-containing protein, partial [Planctomycetota bacterium]|nr:discoidin domain-containing protein [Planctomycetota bacterium]
LYGATVHNFKDVPSVTASVEKGRVRFEKLVIPYTGTYDHMRRSLLRELRRWDESSPLFLAYQVQVWGEMRPHRIVEIARELEERFAGKVELVRADHYFNLYNEAHGLPFNLVLSRSTSVEAGSSRGDAERAIDGTPATLWTSSKDEGARWLRVDLGAAYRIERYVIRHAGASGSSRSENTRSFRLEGSTDGASWTTVDEKRENTANVTDVDVEPIEARYVRITIDDPGKDGIARIADVEIFGRRTDRDSSPTTGGS